MTAVYLMMDMINDLVHPDGPNGRTGYGPEVARRGILENTQRALQAARAAGMRVGYVRVGFSPDYRECPKNSPIFSRARQNGLFVLGTWGTEVHLSLAPQEGDFDVVKHRVSPFYGTSLEVILRTHGLERLVLSGISTAAVVQSAVREGHDRDFDCIVLEDCCCAVSAEEHDAAIASLRRFARITTSGEFRFDA